MGGPGPMGGAPGGPQYIQVTPEEKAAIDRVSFSSLHFRIAKNVLAARRSWFPTTPCD